MALAVIGVISIPLAFVGAVSIPLAAIALGITLVALTVAGIARVRHVGEAQRSDPRPSTADGAQSEVGKRVD